MGEVTPRNNSWSMRGFPCANIIIIACKILNFLNKTLHFIYLIWCFNFVLVGVWRHLQRYMNPPPPHKHDSCFKKKESFRHILPAQYSYNYEKFLNYEKVLQDSRLSYLLQTNTGISLEICYSIALIFYKQGYPAEIWVSLKRPTDKVASGCRLGEGTTIVHSCAFTGYWEIY